MPIVTNSPKKTVIRATGNTTIVVAGNSSVSNIASSAAVRPATGEENISGAGISEIHWSTDALVTIARGANTIFNLNGSGSWNFRHMGITMGEFPAANLVINTATANATIIIELVKAHANGYGSGYQL